MATDRTAILNELAAGDISPAEAIERLRSRGASGSAAPGPAGASSRPGFAATGGNRWLRIRVTNLRTGSQKVNVNLPLAWVSFGLRIGARYAPEIGDVDFNELLNAIQSGASGRLIDVEDLEDGERVEIFVE